MAVAAPVPAEGRRSVQIGSGDRKQNQADRERGRHQRISIVDGARPPATFVMLGGLEFGPRRAQMLQSPPHVGLIGPC